MPDQTAPRCLVVRATGEHRTRQGLSNLLGISRESTGARALCMHLITIPPGARARAHMHEGHETAIYMLTGRVGMRFGPALGEYVEMEPGDFLYIPADMPHLPFNLSDTEPATAVGARTDPSEQESVVLLPELEAGAP